MQVGGILCNLQKTSDSVKHDFFYANYTLMTLKEWLKNGSDPL
jgi:hypothetical protein